MIEHILVVEVEDFYARMKAGKDTISPISYGLNSRLVKENGKLVEKVWKVGGLYSPALEKIVSELQKAVAFAENDAQKSIIGKLLDRFAEESPWTKIYVQSILPVNGVDTKAKAKNHWKKGAEIIEANKLIEALCEGRKNVLYIDVYSALVDQKGMLDQRYTNDGLHLMGEGYLAWKEVIEKYVK